MHQMLLMAEKDVVHYLFLTTILNWDSFIGNLHLLFVIIQILD